MSIFTIAFFLEEIMTTLFGYRLYTFRLKTLLTISSELWRRNGGTMLVNVTLKKCWVSQH